MPIGPGSWGGGGGGSGPQGPQGAQGTAGTAGAQGSQGSGGAAGAQGSQGSQGAQGNTGGAQGAQGAQGSPGSGGSITTASGTLGATVNITSSVPAAIMSTSALAVGTWLVTFNFIASLATPSQINGDVRVGTGTAVATFAGPNGTTIRNSSGNTGAQQQFAGSITTLVTVTVAGTLTFFGSASGTTPTVTFQTAGPVDATIVATGWTALKVA